MDIASAEEHERACVGLKERRIRFLGLETADAVDECLGRLQILRNYSRQGGNRMDGSSSGDGSDGHRVCRKLFPMKELKSVWLGTKSHYLAVSQ